MTEMNPIDQYFAIREGRIKIAFLENEDEIIELFTKYLAAARAAYMTHQNSHWICKGYSKHLLYQRLYESVSVTVDQIAEKMLGLYNRDFLDLDKLNQYTSQFMKIGPNDIENSLEAEKQLISTANELLEKVKQEGKSTLGLEDMIPAHVSTAEEGIYLLNGLL
jgi:DNA-binding ferritin-like protein